MTVTFQTPAVAHVANGVTTAFAYAFLVQVSGDMIVKVDGVTKTLGADYSISGLGVVAGGMVTFTVAPANGAKVLLYRSIPLSRSNDYQANGDLPEDLIDADFDRIWMVLQDIGTGNLIPQNVVRSPSDEPLNELPAAAARALKFPAFDASGQLIVVDGPTSTGTPFSALGESLVSRATDALMRGDLVAAKSGVNTDITSLSNPTIATTQLQTAESNHVATNAWVDRKMWGAIRQTIVFSNNLDDVTGAPSWGGSTGSTSLTASWTGVIFSCAAVQRDINGLDPGTMTWTDLSALSATYYLYIDIDPSTSASTVTAGSTTLAPVYTEGDSYSTVNGQHTFSIPDMQMGVGDGTTVSTVYRVFVGEATTNGSGVVSSFRWYGIRGRATATTTFAASSAFQFQHYLGYPGDQLSVEVFIAPTSTTQHGYLSLASATPDWVNISSNRDITISNLGRLITSVNTSNSINIVPYGGGAPVAITPGNWTMRVVVKRNW